MASLLPGYEYDIFISYRHNDNRNGGVAEFVELLKRELATTIKQPLSIYFDANAHDGLLENHDVDKSLEGKLKCLIFIPIISQTYCDTQSFAWRNEFCAFNKMAKEDSIGRDIKLANGNIASRILPIRIHDLEEEDTALIENEIGKRLRAIDFIYHEQGVNRPLKVTDERHDNQLGTDYSNQLNKVANAIKEIISTLRKPSRTNLNTSPPETPQPYKVTRFGWQRKHVLMLSLAIVILLGALGFFVYQQLSKFNQRIPEKSIAVLPFVNMSKDPDQEYFSDGLSEELLNLLTKIPDLKVIGRTSSFSFKGKNEDLRSIAEKLGVTNILEGSVRKSGNKIRITAQLINATDGTHLWSQTYDRNMDDIFKVQDEISGAVVKELKATLLGSNERVVTQNTEAYNLYLQGKYFGDRRGKENLILATKKFNQALLLDSNYAPAWAGLAIVYIDQADIGYVSTNEGVLKARVAIEKALQIDPLLSDAYAALGRIYNSYDWDWGKADASLKRAIELDKNNPSTLTIAGRMAMVLGRFDEAITLFKKSISLDPLRARTQSSISLTLYYKGDLGGAETAARKLIELNPTYAAAYYRLALTQLTLGKYKLALESILKETDDNWRMYGLPLVYFKLNRKKESDLALKELYSKLEDIGADQIAEAYAFRGETDLAFQWLERAYNQRDAGLSAVKIDPLLINLHTDPRWLPFLKKMGLDDESLSKIGK